MTTPAPVGDGRVPGSADAAGAIYWPGDEEAHRAPGSALVLMVVSFIGGGLYLWQFSRLIAGFDWLAALTLRSSALIVVGGVVMIAGAVLLIRHGLIWASRFGTLLALAPPMRLFVEALVVSGGANIGTSGLAFLVEGGPALVVLGVSFSPSLHRWRRRRQVAVAARRRRTHSATTDRDRSTPERN